MALARESGCVTTPWPHPSSRMHPGKGIAIGFVAGLAVAGGAVLLLRDETVTAQETARVADLDAQIQRLDQAVSRLSVLAAAAPRAAAPATAESGEALP